MPDRDLIRGLVGQHDHLYLTNAEFHYQIHLLADMLPIWIDALADKAGQSFREQELLIRDLGDIPPVFELGGTIGRQVSSRPCQQGQHDLCDEDDCECRCHEDALGRRAGRRAT